MPEYDALESEGRNEHASACKQSYRGNAAFSLAVGDGPRYKALQSLFWVFVCVYQMYSPVPEPGTEHGRRYLQFSSVTGPVQEAAMRLCSYVGVAY